MREEALVQLTYCRLVPFLQNALLNHLRLTGMNDAQFSDLGLSEEQLVRWHLNCNPTFP